MGQATIDLPDPLSESSAAPSANADDLLAQLAGDDIDRLLAEADVERPARTEPTVDGKPARGRGQSREVERNIPVELAGASSGQAVVNEIAPPADKPAVVATSVVMPANQTAAADLAAKVDSDVSAQLDELFDHLTRNDGQTKLSEPGPVLPERRHTAAAAPAPTAEADQQVSAQLDDLFAELTKSDVAPAAQGQADAAPSAPSAPSAAQIPAVDTVVAVVESVMVQEPVVAPAVVDPAPKQMTEPQLSQETQTTQAERAALEVATTTAAPEVDVTVQSADEAIPLMLKPLVWLNQPFAGMPQYVREMLGKVAIVTLVNSLGMILYVLLFRKA